MWKSRCCSLKSLVAWLSANKMFVNVDKIFAISRFPMKRLDCFRPRLKLSGKILTLSKALKYLYIHLDEHLNWKILVSSIAPAQGQCDTR